MERRDFLRGVLLTGSAGLLAPAAVNLIGDERAEAATLAVVTNEDLAQHHGDVEGIAMNGMMARLRARVHAHIEMFNEPPRALFVNRYEMRKLTTEMNPLARYSNSKLLDRGWMNLMVANVPVICIEPDVLHLQPEVP